MDNIKLFDAEYRLMEIIWANEPVNSTELVKICGAELGWKKSTVYTMLRKLGEKGVLVNENATVTSLLDKRWLQKHESGELLKKSFNNSLHMFLTSFLDGRKLTVSEAEELKALIDNASEIAERGGSDETNI